MKKLWISALIFLSLFAVGEIFFPNTSAAGQKLEEEEQSVDEFRQVLPQNAEQAEVLAEVRYRLHQAVIAGGGDPSLTYVQLVRANGGFGLYIQFGAGCRTPALMTIPQYDGEKYNRLLNNISVPFAEARRWSNDLRDIGFLYYSPRAGGVDMSC